MSEQPRTYWLTEQNPDDLGPFIRQRFTDYMEEMERSGRLGFWRLALRRYYGEDHSGGASSSRVTHSGEQGELSEVVANHYRSIITTLLSLTTASRPAFKGTASDDSAEAMTQVELCEQIWTDALESGGLEQEYVDAVRRMLVLQEAGVAVLWDPNAGTIVGAEEQPDIGQDGQPRTESVPAPCGTCGGSGAVVADELGAEMPCDACGGTGQDPVMTVEQPRTKAVDIHAGDLEVMALSPYDVARDTGARSLRDPKWVIVRRRMSRWDLAALYPEHEETILGAPSVDAEDLDHGLWRGMGSETVSRQYTDQVYVLELYADRAPSVPQGRYARVVEDTVLEHGDLQYDRLPVVLAAPERLIDRGMGAAPTADLLGPQQAYDATLANIISTSDAFGRPNIIQAEGQDLDVEEVAGGLNLITYTPVEGQREPHSMQMPEPSDSDLKLLDLLKALMQVLSGANDVVRGDPQESLKSGAALALVQAMAVQHNSPIQKAAAYVLREVAGRVIETYRVFATTERVIEVTGTNEIRTAKRFTGADLTKVHSVHVELANPLLRTIAGKMQIADKFVSGEIQWPEGPLTREQYLAFLDSGRLQHLFRADRSEAIAIREESEAMQRGEPVQVLVTDDHAAHIREHKALLDGRGRLMLPEPAVAAVIDHINEHIAQWQGLSMSNPALLLATGQQPAPMPMGLGAPMPGGPPPGGGGGGGEAEVPDAAAPPPTGPAALPGTGDEVGEAPGAPNARMPMNPATGERVQLPDAAMG